MEECTLKQEFVVSQYGLRLVGGDAYATSFAKDAVYARPHRAVQTSIEHGQHAWRQVSHVFISISLPFHGIESTLGVWLHVDFGAPHLAYARCMFHTHKDVLFNALEYECVYFFLCVLAVGVLGRLGLEETLANCEVLQHDE